MRLKAGMVWLSNTGVAERVILSVTGGEVEYETRMKDGQVTHHTATYINFVNYVCSSSKLSKRSVIKMFFDGN